MYLFKARANYYSLKTNRIRTFCLGKKYSKIDLLLNKILSCSIGTTKSLYFSLTLTVILYYLAA